MAPPVRMSGETIAQEIERRANWPCPWTELFGSKIEPIEDEV